MGVDKELMLTPYNVKMSHNATILSKVLSASSQASLCKKNE